MRSHKGRERLYGGLTWVEIGKRLDDQHRRAFMPGFVRQHCDAFLGRHAADYEAWIKRPPETLPTHVRLLAALSTLRALAALGGVR